MQPLDLVQPFIERLASLGIPYFVTGSIAGILYGEPRLTHDIDLVVALVARDVDRFVAAFPLEDFYCPPEDVLAIEVRRGQRGHCNVIHHATGFKADIYIAFDELHRWAMDRRRHVDVDGMKIALAPIEYVIVRKLEYFRERGSEKHLRDIRSMLEVSNTTIDHAELNRWIAKRGLVEEWKRVKNPDRCY